jgi:hypothetical protein
MRKGQVDGEVTLIVFSVLSIAFLFLSGFALGENFTKNKHYKQGQIDYANGIIKYELKQQANGESLWQEKK